MIEEDMQVHAIRVESYPYLLTCDRPLFRAEIDKNRIIFFPLTHNHLILMSPASDGSLNDLINEGRLPSLKEIVQQVNERIIDLAAYYVYGHPDFVDEQSFHHIAEAQQRRAGEKPKPHPFSNGLMDGIPAVRVEARKAILRVKRQRDLAQHTLRKMRLTQLISSSYAALLR